MEGSCSIVLFVSVAHSGVQHVLTVYMSKITGVL